MNHSVAVCYNGDAMIQMYWDGGSEIMQLIPKRIRPFFVATLNRKDGENSLTEGFITCCDDHEFRVSVIGNIRHGIKQYVYQPVKQWLLR